MKKVGILITLLCILQFILLCAGCKGENPAEKVTDQTEPEYTSMEEEAVLTYEVPVSVPGILVNQIGYTTGSTKVAVFHGEEMPDLFYVVDAETGKIVYTGTLEQKEQNAESGVNYCYGDFSEMTKEGTYYIEAPILGRTYDFVVGENVYDALLTEACKQYYYNRCGMTLTENYAGENAHNACHTAKAVLQTDTSITIDVTGGWHQDEKGQKDIMAAAETMATLLLAYELYPMAFTDNTGIPESGNGIPDILDEIKYEADWLLKMQEQETGAVYEGVSVYAKSGDASSKVANIYVEPVSLEAGKAFAMALAKFSYLYQNYDAQYATSCLKAADRAWKYVEINNKQENVDTWAFAAASELYRASGKPSYHQYVTAYIQKENFGDEWDEIHLLGYVTYISTKHRVIKAHCEMIMNVIMTKAEEVSFGAREAVYLTAGTKEQDNDAQLLLDMMCLSVVNKIIANHEYETVIENHLHYFLGRNETAQNHITSSTGLMKQFEADSKLVMMLSEIMENGR